MASDRSFAQLVSLACHDLRTPLATVQGFARTIDRLEQLQEQAQRYIGLIVEGSDQLTELLDRLALVARIERGAYEPVMREMDSLEVAHAAAARVDVGEVAVSGAGAPVAVDPGATERSIADLLVCAIRHGNSGRIGCAVQGNELELGPVDEEVRQILLGEDLRDFGAAAARIHVDALGGSVASRGDVLRIELPTSGAGTGAGP